MDITKIDLTSLLLGAADAYNSAPNPGMIGLEKWRESFRKNGVYVIASKVYEIIETMNSNSDSRAFELRDLELKSISKKLIELNIFLR